MKILIVKLGAIGDIVHTLPALAVIRRAHPKAEIFWAAEKRSAEILRENPLLDHLIELDTKSARKNLSPGDLIAQMRQQVKALRVAKFDVALDFQGLLKSAVIARLSGAKKIYGFGRRDLREPLSGIFLSEKITPPPRAHIIAKNLALVEKAFRLNANSTENRFEFPVAVNENQHAEAQKIVSSLGQEFAILNPGGGWPTKLWSAEKFGQLAEMLWREKGMASAVTYGPGEKELAERVEMAARSAGESRLILTGPSLKGFYALAKEARLYVGGDTGLTHLAVAAKTPLVGIFGPTEWWRNGSPNRADICVERQDIGCRVDCHRRACSKWICMEIGVEAVFQAAVKRLKKQN
jgi:lipopolysaccharide heptosyltransferase I